MQGREWVPGIRETVPRIFAAALAERPDDIFIDMAGTMVTFAQFEAEVNRFAHGLAKEGVGLGATVCSLADTSMDMLYLWFAVNRLGAIWVPVNSALKGEFLRHQIDDCEARIMIADAHYADRITKVSDRLAKLECLFLRGAETLAGEGALRLRDLEELRADHTTPPAAAVEVDPRDPTLIIYTSGTTGPSKGCLVSQNYICNYAREMGWAIGVRPGDRYWFALPLFHLGGLGTGLVAGLANGARVVIAPQFSVSGFWPDIARSGATVTAGVGATAALVAEAPDHEAQHGCFGQIRTVCAAPMTPAHQRKWKERFGVQHVGAPGYGLTEASMVTLHPIWQDSPPGSSGRRFADFEVRIADADGMELPVGQAGQILVRPRYGQVMFGGYWKRPEATVAATQDFWFNTGDIGRFDEEGFFYFVDRAKDYLRRRGENISSFEVETSFRDHPAIADVAVHAVISDVSEDDLKATIVLKEEVAASEEEICRWSVDALPYYAVPRYIEFRAELPRNPVGRVLKYQLRDEGVTPATWDRQTCPDIVVKR